MPSSSRFSNLSASDNSSTKSYDGMSKDQVRMLKRTALRVRALEPFAPSQPFTSNKLPSQGAKCLYCSFEAKGQSLGSHVSTKNKDVKRFECPTCWDRFTSQQDMALHTADQHEATQKPGQPEAAAKKARFPWGSGSSKGTKGSVQTGSGQGLRNRSLNIQQPSAPSELKAQADSPKINLRSTRAAPPSDLATANAAGEWKVVQPKKNKQKPKALVEEAQHENVLRPVECVAKNTRSATRKAAPVNLESQEVPVSANRMPANLANTKSGKRCDGFLIVKVEMREKPKDTSARSRKFRSWKCGYCPCLFRNVKLDAPKKLYGLTHLEHCVQPGLHGSYYAKKNRECQVDKKCHFQGNISQIASHRRCHENAAKYEEPEILERRMLPIDQCLAVSA